MRELHLFAGAGGGILGGILLGHTCVCAVEIEPYCRKVLLQRQRDGILPKFPIWDDVRTFDGKPWRGKVDVVCGGFPCQDISTAGNGSGISGERSGLWSQMRRIIGEVRPAIVFVENSPALTFRGLGCVLGDLAAMGYNARWGVLGAYHAGAPHGRERIWIIANAFGISRNSSRDEACFYSKISNRGWAPTAFDRSASSHGNFKRTIPGNIGMGDGMADWPNRLKAIGNGQVPSVVRLAWNTLSGEQ